MNMCECKLRSLQINPTGRTCQMGGWENKFLQNRLSHSGCSCQWLRVRATFTSLTLNRNWMKLAKQPIFYGPFFTHPDYPNWDAKDQTIEPRTPRSPGSEQHVLSYFHIDSAAVFLRAAVFVKMPNIWKNMTEKHTQRCNLCNVYPGLLMSIHAQPRPESHVASHCHCVSVFRALNQIEEKTCGKPDPVMPCVHPKNPKSQEGQKANNAKCMLKTHQ